jgi:hypothetical protein
LHKTWGNSWLAEKLLASQEFRYHIFRRVYLFKDGVVIRGFPARGAENGDVSLLFALCGAVSGFRGVEGPGPIV